MSITSYSFDRTSIATYGSFSAWVTAMGSASVGVRIMEEVSITADLTIPATITVGFGLATGSFTVASGKTLTINRMDPGAPLRQLFAGAGTVILPGGYLSCFEHFGAVGNGVTDDYTAMSKAFASGADIQMYEKTYCTSGQLSMTGQRLVGVSRYSSWIKKCANLPYMIYFPDGLNGSTISNVGFDGAMASYTGGCFLIEGDEVTIDNCYGQNIADPTFKFPADQGANALIRGFVTNGSSTSYLAALVSSYDTSTNPRMRRFIDCSTGGGPFVDFSGMVTTFVSGCHGSKFKFSVYSSKVIMVGNRFPMGATSLDVTVLGFDHVITGNSFGMAAGSHFYLDCNGCTYSDNQLDIGGSISYPEDLSAQGDVLTTGRFQIPLQTFTCTCHTTGFDLGNGSIVAYMSRSGSIMSLCITFTVGSSTVKGTGPIYFDAPWYARFDALGSACYTESGFSYPMVCAIYGSNRKIYLYKDGFDGAVEGTGLALRSGSILQINITYCL